MKHSKRARTKHLMAALLRGNAYSWSRKTAAEVLADMNFMLSDAFSFSVYPHEEVLGYVIDELKTFTLEDYERIKHESD